MNLVLNKHVPETLKEPVSSSSNGVSVSVDWKELKETQSKYLSTFEHKQRLNGTKRD